MEWRSPEFCISDFRDFRTSKQLELQPDYQRKAVWSEAAKVSLLDSIFRDMPMPKIYLHSYIKNGSTYRKVIDGQQRLRTIFDYLDDEFSFRYPLDAEDSTGHLFSELPQDVQEKFLRYRLDVNEIVNATDDDARRIYLLVNKYNVVLTKQELRKADFPGKFLDLSEELAEEPRLEDFRIFSPANRRRMGDVEYASELIALLLDGPQDKKDSLDDFYQKYASWPETEIDGIKNRFRATFDDIESIFADPPLAQTRFRQKADFYSLVDAVDQMLKLGVSLAGKPMAPLVEDLLLLDEYISPETHIKPFSEYAVKCISQANSHASRVWRRDFLLIFLAGTYKATAPEEKAKSLFRTIKVDLLTPPDQHAIRPPCEKCGELIHIEEILENKAFLSWPANSETYQLSNSVFIHGNCWGKEFIAN